MVTTALLVIYAQMLEHRRSRRTRTQKQYTEHTLVYRIPKTSIMPWHPLHNTPKINHITSPPPETHTRSPTLLQPAACTPSPLPTESSQSPVCLPRLWVITYLSSSFTSCSSRGSSVSGRCLGRRRSPRRPSCHRTATTARVTARLAAPLEETVLERLLRRQPLLRVVLQHPQHQVLELEVVGGAVAELAEPPLARTARLHAEDRV